MKMERRGREAPMVPLASMGDIAFLLIIFFILTTRFLQEAPIEAELAESADIGEMKPAAVSVIVDKNGVVFVNGEEVPGRMLEHAVDVLVGEAEDKTVMVKIDRGLMHEQFKEVVSALSAAGAEIALVGQPIEE